MTWPKDVTGTKFGKMTALSDTGKSTRTQNRIWLFQCDCGELVERPINYVKSSLKRGSIPACPSCRERYDGSHNIYPVKLELAGQTFGALTAIEPIHSDKNQHIVWRFQCECGALVERVATNVVQRARRGQYPSCGKFQCAKYRKLADGESAINKRYYIYQVGARKRGIVFALSKEETVELLKQPCYYCGSQPSKVTKHHNSRSTPFIHNGIDRVDNTQGYVTGNVVPCCEQCNRAKGKLSPDEFLSWIQQVYRHNYS